MAIVAGCPVMVDTVAFAAVSSWMRQVESSWAPGSSCVALVTGHVREQSGVIGWVRVTGNAGGGENGKNGIGMAFCTGKPGMCTG
jgi:hypothetical protein